jgi:nitric oxide reductase activation protein
VGLLAATMHGLAFRLAIYGFQSRGRHTVNVVRVKRFGEPYGVAARDRLGRLQPAGFTRLGAAVRHGAALLAADAGTRHKLLVTVSDAFPHDEGYVGPYAQADARRAITEARARGIGCLGLTVGADVRSGDPTEVFGTASMARADDVAGLRSELGRLISTAMATAELRRRPC